ncbi:MAG: signal peptidase I [Luteibacter sp.]
MTRWIRHNRGFLLFLLCFGFFRSAVADWNPIPSGSMRPTLLEGDVVLVDRLAYDFKLPLTDISVMRLGDPRRGDVITFTSPADGVRLIKRLVAQPGDVVEMRDEILFINGAAAAYGPLRFVDEPMGDDRSIEGVRTTEWIDGSERTVQFLPSIPARRNFGPLVVPAESYFFLGDNRDDSADSRYIGSVPRRLLIGRAHHILASADIKGDWLPRLERIGDRIR